MKLPENLMLWSTINSPCNIMLGGMKLKKTNSFLEKHNPQAFNSEFIHCKLCWLMPQNMKGAKFPLSPVFSEMKMFLVICTTLRAKNY